MFFLNLLFLESSCPTNRREYSSHFQVTHAFSIASLGQLDTKVQQNLLIFEGMYFRFSCILFLECLCYKIHKVLDQLWENTVHTGLRCWDLGSQAERLGTSSPFSLRKQTTFFFFFVLLGKNRTAAVSFRNRVTRTSLFFWAMRHQEAFWK